MSTRTGMFPPPNAPTPFQPGGMSPMQGAPNPFAPMPPMPLAGMPSPPMGGMPPPPPMGPPPPMAPPPMGAGLGSSAGVIQSSNAPRRRIFGDYLESTLSGGQPRSAPPQAQMAMPPQQRMVAPGTSAMRTPPMPSAMPRPMMYGGEVDIFGYADGGSVQYYEDAGEVKRIDQIYSDLTPDQKFDVTNEQLRKMGDRTGRFGRSEFVEGSGIGTDYLGYTEDSNRFYDTSNIDDIYGNLTMAQKIAVTNPQLLMLATGEGRFDDNRFVDIAAEQAALKKAAEDEAARLAAEEAARLAAEEAVVFEPVVEPFVEDVVVSQPITQITGADSGPGSAVGAGGNFGTGTYTADPVDSSEVNPIDYSQFTGDVGKFSNTGENFALYGPKLNIPTSVSQYMTDPITGGLTTSYGPEMVATSPIGAIKMPARPVGIDIFDWLSTPTYGTMYSGINGDISNMRMGGEASGPFSDSSVPRQTEIAGQPHMLAYINPEEETLLRDLGGSGNPGPGGIPAYAREDGPGSENFGTSASNYGYGADDQREGDGEDNDDFNQGDPFGTNALLDSLGIPDFNPNKNFGGDGDGENNVATNPDTFIINPAPYFPEVAARGVVPSPVFPNSDDGNRYIGPNNPQEALDQSKADFDAGRGDIADLDLATLAGRISRGNDVMPASLSSIAAVSQNFAVPPPKDTTYSDPDEIFDLNNPISLNASQVVGLNPRIDANGNMLPGRADTAADIEAGTLASRNLGPEVMSSSPIGAGIDYGNLGNIYNNIPKTGNTIFTDSPVAGTNRFESVLPYVGNTGEMPGSTPNFSNTTPPAPNMALPDGSAIPSNIQLEMARPTSSDTKAGGIAATGLTYGAGYLSGQKPPGQSGRLYGDGDMSPAEFRAAEARRYEGLGASDSSVDSGLGTDLGNVRPADAGLGRGSGFKSLENIKKEISIVEGTSDEGGYDRLLGYQEKNFNVVPTKMTVQEVLDFQKRRDEDSYAAYSQTVNKKNNQFNKDGTPKISTPVGKYQVVGSTLQELVDDGVVKPNALFNKETQEKIGDYLINEKRGYNRKNGPDVLDGGISPEEFVTALGNEFQGIQLNDFSLSGNSIAPAVSPEVVAQSVEKLNPGASSDEISRIKSQLDESVPVQGFNKFIANVGKRVFLGLGSEFVQGLVDKTEAQRTNIVAQHMSAINEGATPKYDDEGKYIGYDTSTMGTFADKVLAGDAREFLPPTLPDLNYTVTQDDLDSLAAITKLYKDSNIGTLKGKDLDGDGLPDTRTNLVSPVYGDGLNLGDQINMSGINRPLANEYASGFTDAEGNPVTDNSRFQQIYNVQSEAAEIDPNGSSTENGFITSDGREFVVTYDGKLLEVNDGVVGTGAGIFNNGLGTGTTVSNVYGTGNEESEGDGDDNDSIVGEIDTGYTIDESGNRICNEAGYVYDVASDACIIAEELSGNGNASSNIGSGGSRNVRSFNDVLRSIETRPAKIAPISANIKPMAQGGMAGLNRAADNFLRALGG